jgi:hypothetical protein
MPRKSPAQLDREIAEVIAATSGAGRYDPRRATQHAKRKDVEERFPVGSHVMGTKSAFAFEGAVGKVTGYDFGTDEDEVRVKVRLSAPRAYMGKSVRAWAFDPEAIVTVTRDQLAVDKLLERFHALDDKRRLASEELREALAASDRLLDDAERKAADRRSGKAVRAESAITSKMRDLVIQIRAADPTRVPWGWQNTR